MRFLFGRDLAREAARFIARLSRDQAGNTLMIVGFALVPILAMIGGGIDMGRGYLSQSRLQQACDAGVLAARKKLGSDIITTTTPTTAVQAEGDKFFNANFKTGSYGTGTRSFAMNIEANYSITGNASVQVPTTLMSLFGYRQLNIAVTCQAKLNFSNTDVMMVLDTTGSMNETNAGDTQPKIAVLRDVVKNFHARLEAAKTPGTRMRYGFVPYSTNVNVGGLLKSDWLVDKWDYHGRVPYDTGKDITYTYNDWTWTYVSGTATNIAAYNSKTCPAATYDWGKYTSQVSSPDGSGSVTKTENGTYYWCNLGADGSTYTITGVTFTNYVNNYAISPNKTGTRRDYQWKYQPYNQDLAFLKGATGNDPPKVASVKVKMYGNPSPNPAEIDAWFHGCIEERDTYEITDYNNVDLTRALDLDIDLVPTKGNPATQWRPQLPAINYAHSLTWWNWSSWPWTPAGDYSSSTTLQGSDPILPGWDGYAECPAQASKLAEMN
ncbi:MAG: pilus assembly protein, partial [Novosphingobium sp.]